MANIQMGTANGSTLGNPTAGDFYIFIDSNNSDYLTTRDSAGVDTIYVSAGGEANIVNVTIPAELPTVLAADTTYVINGNISIANPITSVGDNSAIIGRGSRDNDRLTYTGAGVFITIVDVNFTIRNLTLSATTLNSSILSASNYSGGAYNDGRNKTLTVNGAQFRDCYDVLDVNGYDLVDFNNTLFFYVQATNFGCRFKSTSKLEFSSCELLRWFSESSLPTPSGYATVPMIEIQGNGAQAGLGAVNLSGNILHPQQTQDGLNISATSTTGFGTIAANTFINIGLTTGVVNNFDIDIQNAYIIQANQGILNGYAKGTLSIVDNLNSLATSGAPANTLVLNEANVGGSFTVTPTFPVANRVITSVVNCSFTYNNKNNGNFFVVLSASVNSGSGGTQDIIIRLRNNGTPITFSVGKGTVRQQISETISFSVIGAASLGDVFDIEVESTADVLIENLTLNGYQF